MQRQLLRTRGTGYYTGISVMLGLVSDRLSYHSYVIGLYLGQAINLY